MFKQVRVAALAGLDFISRSRLYNDIERDHVWKIRGHGHQSKAIFQIVNRVVIWKELRFLLLRRHSSCEDEQRKDPDKFFHIVKL